MRAAGGIVRLALALSVFGCDREQSQAGRPLPLPVRVLADTGRTERLVVEPPPAARLWVARVRPAPPRGLGPALPDAPADSFIPVGEPPALEIDDGLKPPIPRAPAVLIVPDDWRRRQPRSAESVDLEVRVDETGAVSEARWVGGSRDSSLIRAATDCARGMRFYPALRAGRPVAVWCRHRFEFDGRGP